MTTSRPVINDPYNAFCQDSDAFLPGAPGGPLAGLSFAAKDIFDVAGHVTGGGNPDWKATHQPASRNAWVVQTLVDAGAAMVGKTITDELTRGIFGENVHYGTPVNPRAPGRVPGGSSSGSASAVAGRTGGLCPGIGHRGIGAGPCQLLRSLRPPPHPRPHPAGRDPAPGSQLRHHWLVRPGHRDLRPGGRGAVRGERPGPYHARQGGNRPGRLRTGGARSRRSAPAPGPRDWRSLRRVGDGGVVPAEAWWNGRATSRSCRAGRRGTR